MDGKHLATLIAIPMFVLAACGSPPEEAGEPRPDTLESARGTTDPPSGGEREDAASSSRVGTLRAELQAARTELDFFRAERIEAAESLKAIAEHVTRLASAALQRLGKPVA